MKRLRFFFLASAALMLGACSSDDNLNENDGRVNWNSQGKGYLNVAIQLPTQPSTRANDNFDDGLASEYEVKDATLILFVDGNVNSAYDMNLNFSPDGTSDNITTTAKITQEINNITTTQSTTIKALVVLNNNGLFTVSSNNELQIGGTTFSGSLTELNTALSTLPTTVHSWHENGLLMSNAIMANAPGGTTAPTNAALVDADGLVTINTDDIYPTAIEASENPAATIYVERAEAKVTLNAATNGTTDDNKPYTIAGWALDNTNTTNKLVRTVDGFDTWKGYKSSLAGTGVDYRFIGSAAIATGMYRVYWGDDYNYTTAANATTGLTTVDTDHAVIENSGLINADGTPTYCFENTTDLASMTERNLTRVIVKAVFNGGTAFYTVDGDRTKIWPENDLKAEIAARLLNDVTFNAWAKANVEAGQELNSATDFDVTFSTEAAGKRTVTAITLNETGKGKLTTGAENTYPTNAADLANNHITFDYYAGGAAYYPVYIKHFGDDQTPWSRDDVSGSSIYGDEATSSQNYLGRYGALRNNWYDITVNSITGIGDPNVVTVTYEPVDKKESYISVRINVLSWAKRTQSVDL